VPTRAPRPYQRHGDADPKGKCWPGWTRTSVANPVSRTGGPCRQSNRPMRASIGCHPRPPGLQGRPARWSQRHGTSGRIRTGIALAGHWHLGPACIPFHHEREPPPGVEPGRPPYEGGAAGRARRHGFRGWSRTNGGMVQSHAGLPAAHPETVRGTGLEPADDRF
jgi:hypothetical protein